MGTGRRGHTQRPFSCPADVDGSHSWRVRRFASPVSREAPRVRVPPHPPDEAGSSHSGRVRLSRKQEDRKVPVVRIPGFPPFRTQPSKGAAHDAAGPGAHSLESRHRRGARDAARGRGGQGQGEPMRLGYCLMCGRQRRLDKGVCPTCAADELERARRRAGMPRRRPTHTTWEGACDGKRQR